MSSDYNFQKAREAWGDANPPVTPAPKREWVGLTDEEMLEALISVDPATKRLPIGFTSFAQAIEAKLKEKNNG